MRPRGLNALIIDQDPQSANHLSHLIKELFHRLHVQADWQEAIQESKDIGFQVYFINLNIGQRTLNLEMVSKIPIEGDPRPVIFGYNDGLEPELLTHAIENGFQDVFIKPFDADIIASKINRFIQSEKTQARDLHYALLSPPLKAKINLQFKVTAIDENGLNLLSDHYISKGTVFTINHPLVQDIFGQSSMDFMVARTWMGDDWKEYYFFVEPKSPSEQTSAALRRYILSKQ